MEYPAGRTEPILLASSSPRRLELLRGLGIDMEVLPSDVDETRFDSLPVGRRVVALAELKAGHARRLGRRSARQARD